MIKTCNKCNKGYVIDEYFKECTTEEVKFLNGKCIHCSNTLDNIEFNGKKCNGCNLVFRDTEGIKEYNEGKWNDFGKELINTCIANNSCAVCIKTLKPTEKETIKTCASCQRFFDMIQKMMYNNINELENDRILNNICPNCDDHLEMNNMKNGMKCVSCKQKYSIPFRAKNCIIL
jgi:hypothetical protein